MGNKRISFEFPERALKRLDALKADTEATSYAEVIKNSLRLYEALIAEERAGKQFLTRDRDGILVVFKMFPVLCSSRHKRAD